MTEEIRTPARSRLEFLLTRCPGLYERTLRLRHRHDLDKRIFLRVVRRGDVVFDVGANLGYYTILFSHLVGPEGEVHAFEPVPTTFENLIHNVSREKRYSNVIATEMAVGRAEGPVVLYLPGKDHGQASMRRQSAGSWSHTPDISAYRGRSTTLDAYAMARSMDRVDLLKCDAEGAELDVLRGALGLLERHRPLLHLEVSEEWSKAFGYSPADLLGFLSALGYRAFYRLQTALRLLHDPAADLADLRSGGSTNLLCAAPGPHHERLQALTR